MVSLLIILPRTCASKGNCWVNWTDGQEAKEWLGMSSPGSQPMDFCCHELTWGNHVYKPNFVYKPKLFTLQAGVNVSLQASSNQS